MNNATTLYRATASQFRGTHQIADCWTASESTAESYVDYQTDGVVISCEIDMEALNVMEVAAYDRDENYAIGDTAADIARLQSQGVDIIIYDDEDLSGSAHSTYRMISERALSLCDTLA